MNSLILYDKIEFKSKIKFDYKSINHSVITTADNRIFKLTFSWINHFMTIYQDDKNPSVIIPLKASSSVEDVNNVDFDLNSNLNIVFLRDKIYCLNSNVDTNDLVLLSQKEHEYKQIMRKLDESKGEVMSLISGSKSISEVGDEDKELSDYIFKFEKSLFNKNMTYFLSDKKLNKLMDTFKELHEEYDGIQEKCFNFTYEMNRRINMLKNELDTKTEEFDNMINFENVSKNKKEGNIRKLVCYRGELLDEWVKDMSKKYDTEIKQLENNTASTEKITYDHMKKHKFNNMKELYQIKFKTIKNLKSLNKAILSHEQKFLIEF